MRSIFFQTAERSDGAGTQPAGCGGESNEFKVLTKAGKGYALILPNPTYNIQSAKAQNIELCTLNIEHFPKKPQP
ncbi:MAG: hypothetical protein ABI402_01330 [Ferruginibacter sp.]